MRSISGLKPGATFLTAAFLICSALGAAAARSDSSRSDHLTLYKEATQGAFYLLIPKGWKAEGGMIPSGVDWNVVDLVESNIRFRVTSPDGKSFFGWYPRFYFQDPQAVAASSGGMLQPQAGQVLNGCWLYPYLNVAQYVQYIIFDQLSAAEFEQPRILGKSVRAQMLKPWVPQTATRSDYGYVNFECVVRGVPMYGRIYSINYDIGGIVWTTVGTFGLVAPKSRWESDERLMETCIRSFRLDPQWVQRASQAASQRGRQYNQVLRQMHQIDQEIQQQRSQTRSDIQEEFYKVITEQIETHDPQTNRIQYLPMYNFAWTDGRGNYILRDDDDGTLPVDNAAEWRRLKIINRNAAGDRPIQ